MADLIWEKLGDGWNLSRDGASVGGILIYGRDLHGFVTAPGDVHAVARADSFSLPAVMAAVEQAIANTGDSASWVDCPECGMGWVPQREYGEPDSACPACRNHGREE